MMMADNPTPAQIVNLAFQQVCDQHKDNPEKLISAIRGPWQVKAVLEDKLGGPLDDLKTLQKIPSLNMIKSSKDLQEMNGNVVRFSGFVQDMIDQDFFVGFFANNKEDITKGVPAKYMPAAQQDLDDIDDASIEKSQSDFTMNRGNIICTSIPNENKWLREKRGVDDGEFDEVAEL